MVILHFCIGILFAFSFSKSATRLFEVWCEVEPTKSVSGPSGKVVRCFPDTFNDEKVLNDIGEFAFPCDFEK